MKFIRNVIFLLLISAGALYYTNPDQEAFSVFLADYVQEELADELRPRIFSMQKLVEAAHFNMNRIRLVWSRIWSLLSDYFVFVGCHQNSQVAMMAVAVLIHCVVVLEMILICFTQAMKQLKTPLAMTLSLFHQVRTLFMMELRI
mgnify:CR=1 FL=1